MNDISKTKLRQTPYQPSIEKLDAVLDSSWKTEPTTIWVCKISTFLGLVKGLGLEL